MTKVNTLSAGADDPGQQPRPRTLSRLARTLTISGIVVMVRAHASALTSAEFQILLALGDGERHGYDIMLTIARESHGALRVGPTTLYRSIRRLLQSGLIAESDERPDPRLDDQRRRYYRLTPRGLDAARAETGRLWRLVLLAEQKSLVPVPEE
jgi:DNA-binding PadR family transcriptional regulator